jgi:predicted SAM-dependent methyltransferase
MAKLHPMKQARKKLNLGCGNRYMEGWVNLDISNKDIYGDECKIDVKHDLEKFPWPFKDNEFDEVLIRHTLEHLKDINKVMKEMTRITKNNGIITIVVPHFSCHLAYRDPTHLHFFTSETINYIKLKNEVIENKLKASHNRVIDLASPIINLFPTIYERFFYGYFPVQECNWRLRVKK